jgi:hypothetical protein
MTKTLCVVLLAAIATGVTSPAFAQKKQPAQKNQYTVPKEQEHWYDPSCANFNT